MLSQKEVNELLTFHDVHPTTLSLLVVPQRSIRECKIIGNTLILPFHNFDYAVQVCRGHKFDNVIYASGYTVGSTWSDAEQFVWFIKSRMIPGGETIVLS